jgi:DnaJ-class molecular chaperone
MTTGAKPPAQYAPETCTLCQGTGRFSGSFGEQGCPTCGGQGSVLVVQPGRKCAACKGTGKAFKNTPCGACHGSGWAHAWKA